MKSDNNVDMLGGSISSRRIKSNGRTLGWPGVVHALLPLERDQQAWTFASLVNIVSSSQGHSYVHLSKQGATTRVEVFEARKYGPTVAGEDVARERHSRSFNGDVR